MSEPRLPLLQVPMPPPLLLAVKVGAQANFASVSDYVRRALVAQLKLDGLPTGATLPGSTDEEAP